jgi:pyroglutamyl-peptidase
MRIGMSIFLVVILINLVFFSGIAYSYGDSSSNNYVLLSGFEPFYIYTENPSQLITEFLNGSTIKNATILGIVLPVNFSESVAQITQAIKLYDPILVISLGLNAKARVIQLENFGMNIRKRSRSDPFWFIPQRLDTNGPFIRKTTIPIDDILSELRNNDISTRKSFYAGDYVCNAVFYQTLGFIEEENKDVPMGFIHLPPLDNQKPHGVNLTRLIDAITITISSAL